MKTKQLKEILKQFSKIKLDSPFPVLSYILIGPEFSTIGNGDVQLKHWGLTLPVPVLVDFSLFNKIVKAIKTEDISLEVICGKLVINGKHFIAYNTSVHAYPASQKGEPNQGVVFSPASRSAVIKAFNFIADEIRPIMNHVYFNGEEVAATDAHVLYLCKELGLKSSDDGLLLPLSCKPFISGAMTAINHHVEKGSSYTTIMGMDNGFKFEFKYHKMDGKYPNYHAVIPKEFKYETKVDLKAFCQEFTEMLISGNDRHCNYSLNTSGIGIESMDVDFDKHFESSVGVMDEHNIIMRFGHKQVKKILSNYPFESLKIKYSDNSRAAIFDAGQEVLLVMPIMLS